MNDFQNIKRLLLPLLRGAPFILACMAIGLAIAYKSLLYTNPTYESTTKIKLDDFGQGVSGALLYKDFDVFSNTNKVAAEIELLKSNVLIEKAIDSLDFDISYYRVGAIRTTELYHDSPFLVEYDIKDQSAYDRPYDLHIKSSSSFTLSYGPEEAATSIEGSFGDSLKLSSATIVIALNETLLQLKGDGSLIDHFQFRLNSKNYLVNQLIPQNLDVTEVDEDVAVVRVTFKSEVPEKASAFVNRLSKAYVEDYIQFRTGAAGKTVDFIDQQLNDVSNKLKESERRLEEYRTEHNIINTHQETETDLRKIAQLKIQLANLEMNEVALDTLHSYIKRNDMRFSELAPNFEAFNDLLSTELIKNLKKYQAECRELLQKYTPEDEKVIALEKNVADIEAYIKEGINNNRKNISTKRKEIELAIAEAEKAFIGLPTKEREMTILQRDFQLNQKIFNFLTEKRTEAAIASAADIAFHRIIEFGSTPTSPISPNRPLSLIISGLLGLIIGITVIYVREFMGGKVRSREELEKIATAPVCGIIKEYRSKSSDPSADFQSLASNLIMLNNISRHESLLVTSSIAKEGKSFVAQQLAKGFADIGWKVAIVDLNLRKPQQHERFEKSNREGIAEVLMGKKTLEEVSQPIDIHGSVLISAGSAIHNPTQLIHSQQIESCLEELKQNFDLVLIDSPATAISLDAIKLMKLSDHVYYLVRANFTKSHFLQNADLIAQEYGLTNIKLLLNKVHKATNFSGYYTGSRFSYRASNLNLAQKIKHYKEYYF